MDIFTQINKLPIELINNLSIESIDDIENKLKDKDLYNLSPELEKKIHLVYSISFKHLISKMSLDNLQKVKDIIQELKSHQ